MRLQRTRLKSNFKLRSMWSHRRPAEAGVVEPVSAPQVTRWAVSRAALISLLSRAFSCCPFSRRAQLGRAWIKPLSNGNGHTRIVQPRGIGEGVGGHEGIGIGARARPQGGPQLAHFMRVDGQFQLSAVVCPLNQRTRDQNFLSTAGCASRHITQSKKPQGTGSSGKKINGTHRWA